MTQFASSTIVFWVENIRCCFVLKLQQHHKPRIPYLFNNENLFRKNKIYVSYVCAKCWIVGNILLAFNIVSECKRKHKIGTIKKSYYYFICACVLHHINGFYGSVFFSYLEGKQLKCTYKPVLSIKLEAKMKRHRCSALINFTESQEL